MTGGYSLAMTAGYLLVVSATQMIFYVLKGYHFSRAVNGIKCWALEAAEKLAALKGHGFSRAPKTKSRRASVSA
jgi:hypothetical protein